MTIFTRDKATESDASVKPVPREVPRETAPTPVVARPPVAAAQPAAPVARPAVAHSASGNSVSVISKALKITGQLESSEDIQIDGVIDGDVRGVFVKVGNNAKVKGTVYADEVELAGTVEGKIEARKVVLASTGRMSGDVVHQDIRIDSGAYICGQCKPEFGKTAGKTSTPASVSAARTAAE